MANDPIVLSGPDIFSAITLDTTGTSNINTVTIGTDAVTTLKILDKNVTYAKIQNEGTLTLLGNPNGTLQSPQDVPIGPGLEFINGTLNVIGFAYTITPSVPTNENNWAPAGLGTASTVRFSASSYANISGITGGTEGRILLLENNGIMPVKLTEHDSNSASTNQFGFSRNVFLSPNDSIELVYDSTNNLWRLTSKEKDTDSEYYGSGFDGNIIVGSGTTVLSRDMYYKNLTLSGGTIVTNGWKIFVSEMLDISSAPAESIIFASNAALNGQITQIIPTSFGTFTAILWPRGNTTNAGGAGAPAGTKGHQTSGGNGGVGGNNAGSLMFPIPVYKFADGLFLEIKGGSGGSQSPIGLSAAGGGVIFLSARFINRGANSNTSIIKNSGGTGVNGGGGGWTYVSYGSLLGSIINNAIDTAGGSGSAGGAGGHGGRITLVDLTKDNAQETVGSSNSGTVPGTCFMSL